MTPLRAYHDAHTPERTHEEWAEKLGISRSHFTMVLKGSARPSDKLKTKIFEITDGQVTPGSWFEQATAAE